MYFKPNSEHPPPHLPPIFTVASRANLLALNDAILGHVAGKGGGGQRFKFMAGGGGGDTQQRRFGFHGIDHPASPNIEYHQIKD